MGQSGSSEQQQLLTRISRDLTNPNEDEISGLLRDFLQLFPVPESTSIPIKNKTILTIFHSLLLSYQNQPQEILILQAYTRLLQISKHMYKIIPQYPLQPIFITAPAKLDVNKQRLQLLKAMIMNPFHTDPSNTMKIDRYEFANKRHFFQEQGFQYIIHLLKYYTKDSIQTQQHHLHNSTAPTAQDSKPESSILLQLLHILTAVFITRKSTTDTENWNEYSTELIVDQDNLTTLFLLLNHINEHVRALTSHLLKRALYMSPECQIIQAFQTTALQTGAILWIFQSAIRERQSESLRVKTYFADLFELACLNNINSTKLIERIVPERLLGTFETSTFEDTSSDSSSSPKRRRSISLDYGWSKNPPSSTSKNEYITGKEWIVLARKSQALDWRQFICTLLQVHESPFLIWRKETLAELNRELDIEILSLMRQKEDAEDDWNWQRFEIEYSTLSQELAVNGFYLVYLIPELQNFSSTIEVENPIRLAWFLQDRLTGLLPTTDNLLIFQQCLQTVESVILRYPYEFKGHFPVHYILHLLETCSEPSDRFELVYVIVQIQCLKILRLITAGTLQAAIQRDFVKARGGQVLLSQIARLSRDLSSTSIENHELKMYQQHCTHLGIEILAELVQQEKQTNGARKIYQLFLDATNFEDLVRVLAQSPTHLSIATTDLVLEIVQTILFTQHQDSSSHHLHLVQSANLVGYLLARITCPLLTEQLTHSILSFLVTAITNIGFGRFNDLFESYLPPYMIHLLQDNPSTFQQVWNSAEAIKACDILWTPEMKSKLHVRIKKHLCSETTPSKAIFEMPASEYLGDLFLDTFVRAFDENQGEDQQHQLFLRNWTSEMWLNQLITLLSMHGSTADSKMIVKSIHLILSSFSSELEACEIFECLPIDSIKCLCGSLERPLIASEVLDQEQIAAIVGIFNELMQLNHRELRPKLIEWISTKGICMMEQALESKALGIAPTLAMFDFFETLACEEESTEILEKHLKFVYWIINQCNTLEFSSSIFRVLTKVLERHGSSYLGQTVINAGGLVLLLGFLYLSPHEKTHFLQQKQRECVQVLQVFAHVSPKASEVLDQFLTKQLTIILKDSDQRFFDVFLQQSSQDIFQPNLIWTQTMTRSLHFYLQKELKKLQAAPAVDRSMWSMEDCLAMDSYLYYYPELMKFVVVENIYLQMYIEMIHSAADELSYAITPQAFSIKLLVAIKTTEQLLPQFCQHHQLATKQEELQLLYQTRDRFVRLHPEYQEKMGLLPPTKLSKVEEPQEELDDEDEEEHFVV